MNYLLILLAAACFLYEPFVISQNKVQAIAASDNQGTIIRGDRPTGGGKDTKAVEGASDGGGKHLGKGDEGNSSSTGMGGNA